MKRSVAMALVMAIAVSFAVLYAADAKETAFHGVITDDMCGKKHMGGDDKACAVKCVEKGAKFALYDPKADKVFALSDQAKAKEFAAEHVVVMGTLSADGKTITVTGIQKGEGTKEGKKAGK
jgi:hypothetical protein